MKKVRIFLTAAIALTFLFSVQASNDKDGEAELLKATTSSINGKVIDKTTGEAITGAKVHLEDLGMTIYTDFDGNFSVSGVKPGNYKISTSMISYSNTNESVEINTLHTGNVEIELESVK
jgi:CarboxypepD_reg-like domain